MIEQVFLTHHIQKHIMNVLTYSDVARFRDLRPLKIDTNLFSYHLKLLQKEGFVDKVEKGYTLSQKGLSYVDRVSTEKQTIRIQPKIITMLLIQDSEGRVLLQKRSKQPYIDSWTLPYGKVHIDDATLEAAARREAKEKLNYEAQLIHVGDCYIRVTANESREDSSRTLLSTTLVHIFRFNSDDIELTDELQWVKPHKLGALKLAPAVEEIVARCFFNDPFFFEEFNVTL